MTAAPGSGALLGPAEIRDLAQQVLRDGALDFLDMSLWDVGKEPQEEAFKGRSLMSYFTELDRGRTALGAAGKIMSAQASAECLEKGLDFVLLGRAAILHHDFPKLAQANAQFTTRPLPVSPAELGREGLSPSFQQYMRNWPGFVAEETEPA